MSFPVNEAGEPLMSGEAYRFEQYLDQEREDMREYNPDDYLVDPYDDSDEEYDYEQDYEGET